MRGKLILSAIVALVVCVGLGYVWGASGRGALQDSLDGARQHVDLADARAGVLEARVSLYNNNFGDASRHFEDVKPPLRRVKDRYQESGRSDAAASVDAALGHVEEAQRLANKLDQAANSKAAEALDAIKVATGK